MHHWRRIKLADDGRTPQLHAQRSEPLDDASSGRDRVLAILDSFGEPYMVDEQLPGGPILFRQDAPHGPTRNFTMLVGAIPSELAERLAMFLGAPALDQATRPHVFAIRQDAVGCMHLMAFQPIADAAATDRPTSMSCGPAGFRLSSIGVNGHFDVLDAVTDAQATGQPILDPSELPAPQQASQPADAADAAQDDLAPEPSGDEGTYPDGSVVGAGGAITSGTLGDSEHAERATTGRQFVGDPSKFQDQTEGAEQARLDAES
jgi:hypothetical protein